MVFEKTTALYCNYYLPAGYTYVLSVLLDTLYCMLWP